MAKGAAAVFTSLDEAPQSIPDQGRACHEITDSLDHQFSGERAEQSGGTDFAREVYNNASLQHKIAVRDYVANDSHLFGYDVNQWLHI